MKLAILSDIHGNIAALEAVLNKARQLGVEHLLVLGDMVGYYYYPAEVLDLINEWDHDIIRGNHEIMLDEIRKGIRSAESIKKKYGSGHEVALSSLSSSQVDDLIALPDSKSVQFDDLRIQMCHGSPWDPSVYLYPDAGKEILSRGDSKDYDFVFFGHSHYAFCWHGMHSILANPGSVGQSRQKGGQAYWILLDTSNGAFQMRTTHYNTAALKREISKIDPENSYLSQILERDQ